MLRGTLHDGFNLNTVLVVVAQGGECRTSGFPGSPSWRIRRPAAGTRSGRASIARGERPPVKLRYRSRRIMPKRPARSTNLDRQWDANCGICELEIRLLLQAAIICWTRNMVCDASDSTKIRQSLSAKSRLPNALGYPLASWMALARSLAFIAPG